MVPRGDPASRPGGAAGAGYYPPPRHPLRGAVVLHGEPGDASVRRIRPTTTGRLLPADSGNPAAPPRRFSRPPRPGHSPTRPITPADDDDDKTRPFLGGIDLDKLRFPKSVYTLQVLDKSGQWRDWGPIHANGLNVGRSKASGDFPGLNTMAVRHMKFGYNKAKLMVEDLGSLNGVYLRIRSRSS